MNAKTLKGDAYCLIAAMLWGATFIVQKQAMEGMGPFTFTAFRFLLGGTFLFLFLVARHKTIGFRYVKKIDSRSLLLYGVAGVLIFFGINLQQIGLIYTTPTNSALLTSLYIILVPLFLFFGGKKVSPYIRVCGFVTFFGIYLLVFPDMNLNALALNKGDLYSIGCAFFWAAHIIMLERMLRGDVNPLVIATIQSMICGGLSLVAAFAFETPTWRGMYDFFPELIVAGLFSGSLGFTAQVYGQKTAPASHAAILLGSEAVFASLADFLYFGTVLAVNSYIGATLIVLAGVSVQLWPFFGRRFFNQVTRRSGIDDQKF